MGFFKLISLIKTIIDLILAGQEAGRVAVHNKKKREIKENFKDMAKHNEKLERLDALKNITDAFNNRFH